MGVCTPSATLTVVSVVVTRMRVVSVVVLNGRGVGRRESGSDRKKRDGEAITK